jgi:hypothetical protein
MKIDKEILKSRKNLREIYERYSKELFQVINKIDHALELLQEKEDDKN